MTSETIMSIVLAACAGVAATVTMDVLGSISRKLGLTAGASGRWVGRWYLGMLRGRFAHTDIAAIPEQAGEKQAALIGHYVIGVVLAVFYVVGAGWLDVSPGLLVVAIAYGLATCVFPLFLVYPALGFGPLGLRAPAGLRPITTSLMNHLFYGFGLWWAVKVLQLG